MFQNCEFNIFSLDSRPGLCYNTAVIEVWLSLVERYVRDVEAASSNLVTSTTEIRMLFRKGKQPDFCLSAAEDEKKRVVCCHPILFFCAVAPVSRVLCPLRDDGHLSVRPVAGNAPGRRFPPLHATQNALREGGGRADRTGFPVAFTVLHRIEFTADPCCHGNG